MARKFSTPTPAGTGGNTSTRTHHLVATDPAGYAQHIAATRIGNVTPHENTRFAGGMTYAQASKALRDGDMSVAEESEKLLARLERDLDIPSPRTVTRLDVAGGIPCVPAHLAGAPMAMRRRVRTQDEAAPMALLVETASSAEVSPEMMLRRGAAIVALVRLLSIRRPVECWTTYGGNCGDGAVIQWVRIDTAPLDLARASFILGHVAFARMLTMNHLDGNYAYTTQWPYKGRALTAAAMARLAADALPHIGEFAFIPGAYSTSGNLFQDPAAWVREHLSRYAPDATP